MCDNEADGHHSLKNGRWVHEPIGNFDIGDADEGMVCAEWDNQHLHIYYHAPEEPESGPPSRVPCTKEYEQRTNEEGLLVDGVTVRCNRCGDSQFSFGTSERSAKRCLALLNEECSKQQDNFYEVKR